MDIGQFKKTSYPFHDKRYHCWYTRKILENVSLVESGEMILLFDVIIQDDIVWAQKQNH